MEKSNHLLHCFSSEETKHSTCFYPLGRKCNNVRCYIKPVKQYKFYEIEIIYGIGQIHSIWSFIDLNRLTASISIVCYTVIRMELFVHQLFLRATVLKTSKMQRITVSLFPTPLLFIVSFFWESNWRYISMLLCINLIVKVYFCRRQW